MKQKTVKTADKRFKKTGKGMLLRLKMSAQHLVMGKSKRTLRGSKKSTHVSPHDVKKIKRMLPNK